MKKFICALSFAFLLMVGVTNVNAAGNLDSVFKVLDEKGQEVSCDGCLTVSNYVAKVSEGGTLQLQKDVTDADDLTDSLRLDSATAKSITLDLNNHKIVASNGAAIIVGSEPNKVTVTVKGGTIVSTKTYADVITVTKGSNLNVDNCKIYNKDVTEETDLLTETTNAYISGIHVGDDSKVTVTNTHIYANYAFFLRGSNSEVTITDSELHGYAALDITNGIDQDVNTGNKVTVTNSTLTGHNPYAKNASNNYGTVVIGGQEDLELTITGSTVTNTTTNNSEDLIYFGNAYENSKGVDVAITDSTLNNTDSANGSAVFNYNTKENASANTVVTTGTKVEGTEYPADNTDVVYVSVVYTLDGKTVEETKAFEKDKVEEGLKAYLEELSATLKEQKVNVDGYYTDADYKTEFKLENEVTGSVKVYVKTSKVEEPKEEPKDEPTKDEPVKDNDKADEETNPQTSDNIISVVAMGVVSLIVVAGCGLYFKKYFNN